MKTLLSFIGCITLNASAFAIDLPKAPATNAGALLQQNKALIDGNTQFMPQAGMPLPLQDDKATLQLEHAAEPTADTIFVKRFEIDQDFPAPVASKIQALFASYQGRNLSIATIDQVRHQLDFILRTDVDLLVFVELPRQNINQGIIRFKYVPAKIQAVHIANSSPISTKVLEKFLPPPGRTVTVVNLDIDAAPRPWQDMTNSIKRINDLPGVAKVMPQLSPGTEPGTTQVNLEVTPAPRVRAAVLTDNSGSTSSGKNRVGGQVIVNSPLGLGDQLQATAYFAPSALQNKEGQNGHTGIGQISYELPLGYRGDRIGASYARVNYAAGGALADLSDGLAETASLYLTHPFLQRQDASLTLRAALNDKNLTDSLFSLAQKRHAQTAQLTLSGSRQGSLMNLPNTLQFSTDLSAGSLKIRDPGLFEEDSLAHGGYIKSASSLQLGQALSPTMLTSLKISGQLSNAYLDSSEKMSLGGAAGVRAYNNNLASVDQGVVTSLAFTKVLPSIAGLSGSVFYDIARGQIDKSAKNEDGNLFTASGYGVGVSWQYKERLSFDVAYSRRIGSSAGQFLPASAQTWINSALIF
ncbi:ShlB/FhaC/HecB family hemolysin secretion/activation protein [Collimonas sp.]|jgi:hemolysin activation/secretion protein|uniref:ShlB/FhaC/HecB family hemolysin secretion/activation protein n=1 Tax=Collimonas sp. TaxID=1963772 RepID=UPI002C956417|nr:ShlB/FhaC/HecB family hemolysin secretion/activation protein [Collimonas sp.]HWX01517.1 ShlB/FhaC/HecB family hemolysin secretion/activation protein [Collimonas sp.]